MNKIAFIFLGWLIFSTAHGASFDCSIALSEMERVICANPELSKADEKMSDYYFKLMRTLTAEESKALKTEQREWLKQRITLCRGFNSMCLLSQYGHRINELKTKYENLVPLPAAVAASFQGLRPTCGFSEVVFPENFKIYGAGNYAGYQIDKQIDSSGHRTTQFDIAVNSPDQPVVLLLGAYEPSIWRISWTKGTKILAVAVTGYHRQIVIGTLPDTPILISRHFPCVGTYIIRGNIDALNRFSNEIFNRDIDGTFMSVNGKSVVGSPIKAGEQLLTSTVTSIDDFLDKDTSLAGHDALNKAIAEGQLRRSNGEERQEWRRRWLDTHPSSSSVSGNFTSHPIIDTAHTYVILKPFRIPAGLTGGNSAVFFLPYGVKFPEGDIGGATLYDLNTMSCYGNLCSFPCRNCRE